MLDFVIFAVTFVAILVGLVIYLYPGSRRQTTVAGLDPSHEKEGNIPDIIKADSFHEFLIQLHQKFGRMASFWLFGPTLAISISDPNLIKSIDYLSEKPKEVNQLFESFVGTNSLLFAQKSDARKQRTVWELMFSERLRDNQNLVIKKLVSELVQKWLTIPVTQHIPVGHYMKAFTIRLCLISGFGDYFAINNNDLIEFSRSFENCFTELELRTNGDLPQKNSPRSNRFEESVDNLKVLLKKAIQGSKKSKSYAVLSPLLSDGSLNDQTLIDECMTYVFMYYSLSSALMWTLFYLSSDETLQEEINEKISINIENDFIDKVIESAISAANVVQWTSRVNPDVENEIDGHLIPKGTPIICHLSSHYFQNNDCDSPLDLFRKHFDSNDEKPFLSFGSKGSKRCCPAEDYSKSIIKQIIIQVISHFRLHSIDSDLIPRQVYRIYSKSEEEIWITIAKRV
jgi:cytochrome P450 family 20 subfamily A